MWKFIFSFFVVGLLLISIGVRCEDFSVLESQLAVMKDDTIKVNTLLYLGTHYCYTDADKALLFFQQALVLSVRLGYEQGIASGFLWQGRAYYYKDEYDLARLHLEKAKEIFEETSNQEGMINYHQFTGAINSITGNFTNAIRNYQNAIDLSKQLLLKKDLYLGLCGLGNVYLNRSDPTLAKKYFIEALSLVYHINDPALTSILFTNLGKAHELTNDLDSALLFYERSLEKRLDDGGVRMIASSEYNIGSILIKMGQFDRALQNLEASKNKYIEMNDDTGVCINMLEISKGLFHKGKTDEALDIAQQAIALANKLNNPSLKSDAYMAIAPVMALAGFYDVAYNYMLANNAIKDSLALVNKEKIISELEIQFQTSRISDENKLLKSRNEIQHKNILLLYISLTGSLIILALLFVLFRLKSKSLKRQQELYKSEKTIREQETKIREKEQLLLEEQLETKNRELASKALEMLRVNETLGDVIEKLGQFRSSLSQNEQVAKTINNIICGLEGQLKHNSWNEFEKIFTNIHSEFFEKLLNICPDLTGTEIKIAALLKLNLNTKEIAAITFKSEAGIKSTRYRLRKKLALDNDESLIPFLMKLS